MAKLTQEDETKPVLIRVTAENLAQGFHGFHVHAVGSCGTKTPVPPSTARVPFDMAGSHFNPARVNHGAHAGDLPVLPADSAGTADLRFTTRSFDLAGLFDDDGSALIIHAGPDNYGNVPDRYVNSTTLTPGPDGATLSSGDAGGRVACAVLAAPTT